MIDWKKHTFEVLKTLNHRAKKSLGQNFLINKHLVNQIVQVADIQPSDHILEIGGGIGILTDSLVKSGAKITVIEKDKGLAEYLRETFPTVEVIIADALRVDWPENCRIISNLPYSISTPLLGKILHHSTRDAILMLQKEVAQRCIAIPGTENYSRLSILCELHAERKIIFNLGPESFVPPPKVDSSVIHVKVISKPIENTHEELELLARNLFSLRRRVLRSVIRGFLKRKVPDPSIWDNVPYQEQRISHLDISQLDEILTYLKTHDVWPLAGETNASNNY